MKKAIALLILAAGALAAHGQPAITGWGLNGSTPTVIASGAGPSTLGAPPSSTLYGYNATGVQPGATYTGGISATGNPGQTCTITIAGGTTAAVGTVTLSTINGVPSPAVIAFNGIYKVESCSFTLLRDSAAGLMTDLTAFGLGSYGDAEFVYSLSVFEPVAPPSIPIQTVLTGCRITGVEEKHAMGSDELVTEFTVQPLFLIRTVAGLPMSLWSTVRSLL